ncbi:MAG: tRNA uridine-5-carboxymethylaminomethyl(34) synthesis enzyme MnmG [Treponemataceae bacterium]
MSFKFSDYDIIVVGAGHAGIEAGLAAARIGMQTLLITQNLDAVARLSCNPSIGGISKGNIVREIDALGGVMGKLADNTMIQYRLLNKSRGPAVQAPRVQVDKALYSHLAKQIIESEKNLHIFQDTVVDVLSSKDGSTENVELGVVTGVKTERGRVFKARAVILATGTFLEGRIYIGEYTSQDGRLSERAALGLGDALAKKGFKMTRLKTGTPARILRSSIDFSKMQEQDSEPIMRPFSFDNKEISRPTSVCYVTYTNKKTHKIIQENIHRSPLYSGAIHATGARYCPSIEDKIVKFPERERHQIFIEPEGLDTEEMYINGLSSSMPEDVQDAFIRSVVGLENAIITRPGYAVDYAIIYPTQLNADLQAKSLSGLFAAGQINGTSGYEEAGGQGLIAGINAALFVQAIKENKTYKPFILRRDEAYIGVMIDDLITQGVDEPYRMFTARAEYRLKLRHNTADERLTERAYKLGLQRTDTFARVQKKQRQKNEVIELWKKEKVNPARSDEFPQLSKHKGETLEQALHDPAVKLEAIFTEEMEKYPPEILQEAETEVRYADYIIAQDARIAKMHKMEKTQIPESFDYDAVSGLSTESKNRLKKVRPQTLGQASRIQGIRPSDIMVLMVEIAVER